MSRFIPRCMDERELAAWTEMNERTSNPRATPCADCLIGFALEMRDIHRCNGTPAGYDEHPDPMSRHASLALARRAK